MQLIITEKKHMVSIKAIYLPSKANMFSLLH